jgi:hypothetical protein
MAGIPTVPGPTAAVVAAGLMAADGEIAGVDLAAKVRLADRKPVEGPAVDNPAAEGRPTTLDRCWGICSPCWAARSNRLAHPGAATDSPNFTVMISQREFAIVHPWIESVASSRILFWHREKTRFFTNPQTFFEGISLSFVPFEEGPADSGSGARSAQEGRFRCRFGGGGGLTMQRTFEPSPRLWATTFGQLAVGDVFQISADIVRSNERRYVKLETNFARDVCDVGLRDVFAVPAASIVYTARRGKGAGAISTAPCD